MNTVIALTALEALAFLTRVAYAYTPAPIPLNWTIQYPCAVDTGARILAGVVTTQSADNTPASCIERCDAVNFAYAGVEYSNECHCGTGLKGTPTAAPESECDFACTGDAALSCGGSFRIQIYKSPALAPGAWALQGCFVDTALAPAYRSPVVHHTFASNLDLVDQCINFCEHIGYPFSGVEDANDCQCSFGLNTATVQAPEDECNSTCPLPPGAGNEYCGGVQRLQVYKYQSH
ncbi:WSC-domain-containing protein [Daedaleopsis nitida]|nr:WSC-domain-containing protein [Daedaleopsis nitida]